MKFWIIHLRYCLCIRLSNPLIRIYPQAEMLYENSHFSRAGTILTIFPDRESKMVNPLIFGTP